MAKSFEEKMKPLGLDREPQPTEAPKERERPVFDREAIRQQSEASVERVSGKISGFGKKIREGFIGLFGKIRKGGKEVAITVRSAPAYAEHGIKMAGYATGEVVDVTKRSAGRAYETVTDQVAAGVEQVKASAAAGKEFALRTYEGTIDSAKAGYDALEGRARDAYGMYRTGVESTRSWVRQKRQEIVTRRLERAKASAEMEVAQRMEALIAAHRKLDEIEAQYKAQFGASPEAAMAASA